jgi:hypothetical protein
MLKGQKSCDHLPGMSVNTDIIWNWREKVASNTKTLLLFEYGLSFSKAHVII